MLVSNLDRLSTKATKVGLSHRAITHKKVTYFFQGENMNTSLTSTINNLIKDSQVRMTPADKYIHDIDPFHNKFRQSVLTEIASPPPLALRLGPRVPQRKS